MLLILIVLNIILIIIIFFLIFSKYYNKNTFFSNFENIELIEFQKGLKELIDELNKITNTGIKELDSKKKEIENSILLIDSKIKELKYLVERNQIIRQSEYKKEITYGNTELIEKAEPDITDGLIKQKFDKKNNMETQKKIEKKSLKILIDENKDEKLNNFNLKYSQVHNLIKNGISIEEISKITGLTKGEIELIKNIKKQ